MNGIGRLLALALRQTWRDARGGELRVLAAALVIACAAVAAVGFFTDRIRLVLDHQAGELLAADLVIAGTQPPADFLDAEAARRGLAHARTLTFPSVVLNGETSALAELKAVAPGYPLRGTLKVAPEPYAPATDSHGIPARGTVWADAQLLGELGAQVGDRLDVGAGSYTIARVLAYEPDRGGDLFSLAPRLLMHLDDVPATQLVQPGSRVTWRLLLAGAPEALAGYRDWLGLRLPASARVQDVREARPELRVALERAGRFLGLAATAAVLVAGVGIAIAARRYALRHRDAVALMRCFGVTQRRVLALYGIELVLLGLAGGLVGAALGWLAQQGLASILGTLAGGELPAASWRPLPATLATGLVAVLGYAAPPLAQLRTVPPLRVLRRESAPADPWTAAGYVSATLAAAALVLWQAGEPRLAGYVLAGTLATGVVLAAGAWALTRLLGRLRARVGVAWRFGLANVARRGGASVVQVVAIGIGLMVLLVLTLVRTDLLAGWRASLPPEAPNRFLINIQPGEVAALQAQLRADGLGGAALHPMVRGRLTQIGDRPVAAADYAEPRAQRLVEREFNLSWAARPQPDNRIVAGTWFGADARGRPEVSVEQGLAETLGIRLGDRLRFAVAGQTVEGTVTSLRSVEWDSFNVNFFVVFPPGVLDALPATWITSFYLPPGRQALVAELVRAHPSVTVLDIEALMQKVREIVERVVLGVEYVFLFTLAAGLAVLYAAIQATHDERRHEAALARTLGAPRSVVLQGLIAEFAVLGLLAGVLAATGASALGWGLARQVFDFAYRPDPLLWLAGAAAGVFGVGLAGLAGTRAVLDQPPLATLRAGG